MTWTTSRIGLVLCALLVATPAFAAEAIKVALSKILAYGDVPIALDKGYFAAEGLAVQLVYFDSAQPVAVAVVAGDADFGIAGATAGFFNLAGQGALRLIAGANHEVPGFHSLAFLASNHAYAAGMTSVKDLPGHSIAITQVGTPLHYAIARVAETYGFPLSSLRILPMQSNSNVNSALVGGQVDAAAFPVTPATKLLAKGDVKLLACLSDAAPGTPGSVLFVQTKIADQRPATVERFLRAYRRAANDFHDAFAGPDGTRRDGPMAPEILDILARFAGITVEEAKLAIPYADRDGRLDVAGVLREIQWYKSQNLLKGDVDGNALIDRRYVVAMPSG